jgi:hypothetical protein
VAAVWVLLLVALAATIQVFDDHPDGATGTIIPALVLLLGPGSSADVQADAARSLFGLAREADNQVKIAAAGAIPPLVKLLGPGSPAEVQLNALKTLAYVARDEKNKVTIASADAILPLLLVPGPGLTAAAAAFVLANLASHNADNAAAIAAAGAIPLLVKLLGSDDDTKLYASSALQALGNAIPCNRAVIVAAAASANLFQEEMKELGIDW